MNRISSSLVFVCSIVIIPLVAWGNPPPLEQNYCVQTLSLQGNSQETSSIQNYLSQLCQAGVAMQGALSQYQTVSPPDAESPNGAVSQLAFGLPKVAAEPSPPASHLQATPPPPAPAPQKAPASSAPPSRPNIYGTA